MDLEKLLSPVCPETFTRHVYSVFSMFNSLNSCLIEIQILIQINSFDDEYFLCELLIS